MDDVDYSEELCLEAFRSCSVLVGKRGLLRLRLGEDFDYRIVRIMQSSLEYLG